MSHRTERTGLYRSWEAMKRRCRCRFHHAARWYADRGISYAPRWGSFRNFRADMESSWFPRAELHRRNVDRSYYKGNCIWLSKSDHLKQHQAIASIRRRGSKGRTYYAARRGVRD